MTSLEILQEIEAWLSFNTQPSKDELNKMRNDIKKHLSEQLNILPISASWVNNNYKSPKARDFYKTINSDLKEQDTYFDGNCWLINPQNQRPVFMWKPNLL